MWYLSRFLTRQNLAPFCTTDQIGKYTNSQIMRARTPKDIDRLLTTYKGKFNLINITTLLKKVSKQNLYDPSYQKRLFSEVSNHLLSIKQINRDNVRAFANIIGYTANMNYHGLNYIFKKIKYNTFFTLTNSKQFLMAFTGLLKLGILQEGLDQPLEKFVDRYVTQNFEIGYLISIWRNLIREGKSNETINKKLGDLISLRPLNQNLKDFGYLAYCYINTHGSTPNRGIGKILQKYPEEILYSNRVNIFQLCNIMDAFYDLRKIIPEYQPKQLDNLILMHFNRNISYKNLDLRSLSNCYHSLMRYFGSPPPEAYHLAGKIFIRLLSRVPEEITDFQSVISLLIDLSFAPQTDNEQDSEIQWEDNFDPLTMGRLVNDFFFGYYEKVKEIDGKHFQKLIFGLSVFKKETKKSMDAPYKKVLREEVLNRDLTEEQIRSLRYLTPVVEAVNIGFCIQFQNKLMKADPGWEKQSKALSGCVFKMKEESCCQKCRPSAKS